MVCIKDHGLEERWISGINAGLVWVIERHGQIAGVAALSFSNEDKSAFIRALYLTPEVLGLGLGRQLMDEMLAEAKNGKVRWIKLESTITARGFYAHFGFKDDGPVRKIPIGGIPVTAFPMQLDLLGSQSSERQATPTSERKSHSG